MTNRPGSLLVCFALLAAMASLPAEVRAAFDLKPEHDVLLRLLGDRAAQFELGAIEAQGGHERDCLPCSKRNPPYHSGAELAP